MVGPDAVVELAGWIVSRLAARQSTQAHRAEALIAI